MNRYPLWKYVVIVVALVVGVAVHAAQLLPGSAGGAGRARPRSRSTRRCSPGRGSPEGSEHPVPRRDARPDRHQGALRRHRHPAQGQGRHCRPSSATSYIVALNLLSASPHWLASIGALPMYLGLDLRGGVHFLLQVDMKAALDKAGDRFTTDIRSLLRNEEDPVRGHRARRRQCRVALSSDDGERVKARAASSRRTTPTWRCARATAPGGDLRLIAGLEARGAEAHPGRRGPAEHPDPAQPRQRTRRGRADHPAAGRDRIVVQLARRAGHGARQGHPRPHRHAGDPHGQRRARRARSGAGRAACPLGSDLFTERDGQQAPGASGRSC